MTVQFHPDGFAQFRSSTIAPLREGAAAAVEQVRASSSVPLPRHLAGAQRQVEDVLARVPEAIAQLQAMTETFDRKLGEVAAEYARADEAVAQRLTGMTGRQP